MSAVEIPTQAPATDPRIDKLIQAVAEMKASIEKEDSTSNVVKRLRPLANEVYDEVYHPSTKG